MTTTTMIDPATELSQLRARLDQLERFNPPPLPPSTPEEQEAARQVKLAATYAEIYKEVKVADPRAGERSMGLAPERQRDLKRPWIEDRGHSLCIRGDSEDFLFASMPTLKQRMRLEAHGEYCPEQIKTHADLQLLQTALDRCRN